MPSQRVLILGLDAVTFDIINPLLSEGVLPNIERVLREGTSATLISVRPPNSAAAWPSVYTGLTPGQHGVFDFRMRCPGSYMVGVVDSRQVRGHRLWEILAAYGKTSGWVNCPITYPPCPLNGFMITGLPTPHYGCEFTYPASLKRDLELAQCSWQLEVRNLGSMTVSEAVERTTQYTRAHTKALLHLMKMRDWDLLLTVYRAVDVLQHEYFSEESFVGHPPTLVGEKGNALRQGYRELDRAVGEILASLPPRTTVMAMSDHGMRIVRQRFHVNDWLKEQGFLERSSSLRPVLLRPPARKTLGQALKSLHLHQLERALPDRMLNWGIRYVRPAHVKWGWVDYRRTKAFCDPCAEQSIRVNVSGRDAQGIVHPEGEYQNICAEIVERLHRQEDPETREPIIETVWHGQKLYPGPYASLLPDLIVQTVREEVKFTWGFSNNNGLFSPPRGWRCVHGMQGILALWGHSVHRNLKLPCRSLLDLAPTALFLLGLPVPQSMAGDVITDALIGVTEPVVKTASKENEVAAESADNDVRGSAALDIDIVHHLEGLGYL